ncbi:MAG TPA: glutamate--cysteine ligase [Actinopolymorphaceae bacterium]
MDGRRMGIEEELLLVDPHSGVPRAVASAALRSSEEAGRPDEQVGGELGNELWLEQLETGTVPCHSIHEVESEIRRWRRAASRAARAAGSEAVALGTSPLPVDPSVTPRARYRRIIDHFQMTAHEQLVSGCHVHVEIASDDEGVAIIDGFRPWLPALLALTANSPFWQGRQTHFASYRSQVISRWPSAGAPPAFGSAKAYHALVRAMLDTGVLIDEGMIYFDVRLSRRYPTVEVRVGDVCLDALDTVLVAGLIRALAETEAREWAERTQPSPTLRPELLRVSLWQAARFGLDGELVHPVTGRPAPARAVVQALRDRVTPVLRELGELDVVGKLLEDGPLRRGTGAHAQRKAYAGRGALADVVSMAVGRTLA